MQAETKENTDLQSQVQQLALERDELKENLSQMEDEKEKLTTSHLQVNRFFHLVILIYTV